jgi:hypothetical protein
MTERQVDALYCDDVRHEIGGKKSFIGTYHAELWVPEFPALLPKLAVAYWVQIPFDKQCDYVTIRVLLGDNVVFEENHPLTFTAEEDPFLQGEASKGFGIFMHMHGSVIFSPITIEHEAIMRVRAITSDGQELRAPSLRIRTAPEGADTD